MCPAFALYTISTNRFRYLRNDKKVNDNNMQVETLELQSEKNRKRLVEIVYKAKIRVDKKGDQECIFQHSQSPILPLFQ